ncbi:MAG: DUF6174 domain-containing protein [Chloroflexota bacterium]|nr:DUF6174 domain-containing protein [Chloroflexota bacterium]MDQ5866289.1 DUF6174 domain-containing protein [Chloroflexota bacterium]
MPAILTNQTPGTVARALLGTLLTLWLVTGSNLFGYRYWNVTQDKYEAALAKWHNLPIAEYEETLTMVGLETWKIVVQVERTNGVRVEKVKSVESLDEDAADREELWDAEDFEQDWTVDALFRIVNLALQRPDGLNSIRRDSFTEIKFDPVMGYPRTFNIHDARGTTQILVVDVKVLK